MTNEQKRTLLTTFFDQWELYKIFDTTDIEWLVKQNITIIKESLRGWYLVKIDNVIYTSLNPYAHKGWSEKLEELTYPECPLCKRTFPKDQMQPYKRMNVCQECIKILNRK